MSDIKLVGWSRSGDIAKFDLGVGLDVIATVEVSVAEAPNVRPRFGTGPNFSAMWQWGMLDDPHVGHLWIGDLMIKASSDIRQAMWDALVGQPVPEIQVPCPTCKAPMAHVSDHAWRCEACAPKTAVSA